MKVKLIRDMEVRNIHWDKQKDQELRKMGLKNPEPRYVRVDANHVIEHPNAWRLIYSGVAVPADKEAEDHVILNGFDGSNFEKSKWHYERANRGISPEDFDHYEKGLMNGYNEKGEPTLNGQPVELPDDDDDYDD